MSVINKVLRDLDRRNEPDDPPARPGQSPLRAGVASVATAAAMAENATPLKPAASGKSRRPLVLAVLTAVVLAGAVWDRMTPGKTAAVAPALPAAPALQPASGVAVTMPPATQPPPAAEPPPKASPAKPPAARASAPAIAASAPVRTKERASAGMAPADPSPRAKANPTASVTGTAKAPAVTASPATTPAQTLASAPASAPPSPPATPAAGQATGGSAATTAAAPVAGTGAGNVSGNVSGSGANDPAQVVLRQQQAARDALAQAQSLWNNGSKDAAIDLLQQAVATAERSMSASSANRPQLVMLTRELTRMLLADGRAQAAWDVLLRLEPQLAGDVDLLAVRANAAQRLGRHQDSVQAYTAALQSRPREQRWMLGAAVSLAALGQTAKATEMAESARQVGPIAREVQAYLRQVGVVLREP